MSLQDQTLHAEGMQDPLLQPQDGPIEEPPSYSPQAISDILPIYRPLEADGQVLLYKLQQTSSNIQCLVLHDGPTRTPTYAIKSFQSAGFMNRKPHIVISRPAETTPNHPPPRSRRSSLSLLSSLPLRPTTIRRRTSPHLSSAPQPERSSCTPQPERSSPTPKPSHIVAEARFAIMGTGTTIDYISPRRSQTLELEDSHTQCLLTHVASVQHWWRPYPGNRNVWELVNVADDTVARFVFAAPLSQARRPETVKKKKAGTGSGDEVGELQVVRALVGEGESQMEDVLCGAVVVVERAKRRARNVQTWRGV